MTTHTVRYQTDTLMKGMRALLTSLPSEEEKNELIRTLKEAQSFLEDFRLLVESIPTMESSQELAEGLSRLDILAERAQRDAGLRRLMGLRDTTKPTAKRPADSQEAKMRAGELEQELARLEAPDIETVLQRSGEPLSVLTELAAHLGMKTRSKERKSELIRRIATHISNWRGYRLLGVEDPNPISVPEVADEHRSVLAGRIAETDTNSQ